MLSSKIDAVKNELFNELHNQSMHLYWEFTYVNRLLDARIVSHISITDDFIIESIKELHSLVSDIIAWDKSFEKIVLLSLDLMELLQDKICQVGGGHKIQLTRKLLIHGYYIFGQFNFKKQEWQKAAVGLNVALFLSREYKLAEQRNEISSLLHQLEIQLGASRLLRRQLIDCIAI